MNADQKSVTDFFAEEERQRDVILFRRCYATVAGDLASGLMLSQLVYWFMPSKKNVSRLSIEHDGSEWIAKTAKDWMDECCLTPKQARRCLENLVQRGLVHTTVKHFNGVPVTHIRPDIPALIAVLEASVVGKTTCPTGQVHLPSRAKPLAPQGKSYKEAETTTETTAETEEQGQVPLNWNVEEGNTTTERAEKSSGEDGPPRRRSGETVFEVPGWVPAEQWMDFVKFRKDSGKAIRGETGARYAIRSLERLRESGNDPAEVLAQSIANGWIGLFAVKNGGNGNGKLTAGQQTAINAERVLERLRQREAAENLDGAE